MALQVVVDVQAVGHKHQGAMQELTQVAAAVVDPITTQPIREVMVAQGL